LKVPASSVHVGIIAEKLVEPSDSGVVNMLDVLPPEEADFYGSEQCVVDRSGTSDILLAGIEQRYAFVGGSREEYLRYLWRPDLPRDMWRLRPASEAKAVAGLSAVPKKDGSTQRKLLMAVSTNAQWRDPRSRRRLGMAGGGVFGSLAIAGSSWAVSAFDAEHAFTRVLTPEWWWPWFATPAVLAWEVWELLEPEVRQRVGRTTAICPQYMRLAMGGSHAVAILMCIGLRCAGEALTAGRPWAESALRKGLEAHESAWETALRDARCAGSRQLTVVVAHLGKDTAALAGSVAASLAARRPGLVTGILDWSVPYWSPSTLAGASLMVEQADGSDWDLFIGVLAGGADRDLLCESRLLGWQLSEMVVRNEGAFALLSDPDGEWSWGLASGADSALARVTGQRLSGEHDDGASWELFSNADGLPPWSHVGRTPVLEVLCDLVVPTLGRYHREGSGPTGARSSPGARPRVTHWGRRAPIGAPPRALPAVAFLNEDVERHRRTTLRRDQMGFYLHVDDGLAMGVSATGPDGTDALMHATANGWERAGFVVKDRRTANEVLKVVGYEISQAPPRVQLPGRRSAQLHDDMTSIIMAEEVWLSVLSSALGVWVWGAVLRRELLAVPALVFRQLDACGGRGGWNVGLSDRPVKLWKAVRRELVIMRDLIPYMFLEIGAQPGPGVFGTDARGERPDDHGGFGIVVTAASADEVWKAFELSRDIAHTVARVDGDQSQLLRPDRFAQGTVPRTRLDDALLKQERWSIVEHGGWRYTDHINLGEMRTVARLCRRLAGDARWHHRLVISLQDNSTCSGALSKGRSPAPSVNFLCRQVGAAALAASMRLVLPWVESCRQVADGASRL